VKKGGKSDVIEKGIAQTEMFSLKDREHCHLCGVNVQIITIFLHGDK
jgi:hypothetical protein